MKISSALIAQLAAAQPDSIRRDFTLPQMAPGVLPRNATWALDSAFDNMSWLNNQQGFCGMGFPGYTYLAELAQRSEYRAPTETIANEMTREWVKFTGADEKKLKELQEAFEEFRVQDHLRALGLMDGFYGRGQLYINIKGQESDVRRMLPLLYNPANIPRGSLLGFKPIEPVWTTPYMYNSNDPTRDDFYVPSAWYVLGKRTHATRLLTVVGRPLPDLLKPAYNFGGLSLSQMIEPYVVRWLKTVDGVNKMINNYSTSGVSTNMQAELAGEDGEAVKRAHLFNVMRGNLGLMVLDKDSEEFFQYNTPLSELSKLQAQAQEHMAAPTHIPLVKLTGISPSGLNASSEGEIKVFYDFIAAEQENTLDTVLTAILKIVQCHLWGAIDPDIKHQWVPLDTPTDTELAQIRKSDADAAAIYIDRGTISPDEDRERLRNDPNSGYTHLTGLAPDPPMQQEHELGEESAESAHARGEKSKDADVKRQTLMEKVKSKLMPKAKSVAKR